MKQKNNGKGKGKPEAKTAGDATSVGWETKNWALRQDDWAAPVHSVSSLAECISTQQVSPFVAVVLIDGDDEQEMFEAILCGHKEQLAITSVRVMRKAEELPDGFEERTVPGRVGATVTPRRVRMRKYGEGALGLKRAPLIAKAVLSKVQTVLMKIEAEARYVEAEQWKQVSKDPARAMRAWASELLSKFDLRKLGDTFKPQHTAGEGGGRPAFYGLWRVEPEVEEWLIGISGKRAPNCGHRFFVQPFSWGGGRTEACNVQPRKRTAGEKWVTFADRCASDAGLLGVAINDRGLGIRVPRLEGDDTKVRLWRARGVPRDLSPDQVEEILAGAGFEEVELVRDYPGGKGYRDHSFRTRTSRDWASQELEYGGDTILCYVDGGTPNRSRVATKLPPERTKKHEPKATAKPSGAAATPAASGAPATADAPPGPTQMDDDSQDADRRRPAAPATGRNVRLRCSPPPWGDKVANAGQGNCLPITLAQGLTKPDKVVNSVTVRARVQAHIKKYPSAYRPFWDGNLPAAGDVPSKSDFANYVELIAKPGAWLSSLEIRAAAEVYDVSVVVHSPESPPQLYNGKAKGTQKPIHMWFEACHYEWIKPKGKIPDNVLEDATAPKDKGSRGAGASEWSVKTRSSVAARLRAAGKPPSEWSVKTRPSVAARLRAGPRAPSVWSEQTRPSVAARLRARGEAPTLSEWSVKTRSSAAARLRGVKPSLVLKSKTPPKLMRRLWGQARKADAAPAALRSSASADATEAPTDGGRPSKAKARFWTCPKCKNWRPKTRWATQEKRQHILAWHPEFAAKWSLQAERTVKVTILTAAQKKDAAWTCPLCQKGFMPGDSSIAQRYARLQHGKEAHPRANIRRFYIQKTPEETKSHTMAMSVASRNKGLMNKVMYLKMHNIHGHAAKIVQVRKRSHLFCTKCTSLELTAKRFCEKPCKLTARLQGNSSMRGKAVARLRQQISKAHGDAKAELQAELDMRTAAAGSVIDVDRPAHCERDFVKIRWPLGFAPTKLVCKKCGGIQSTAVALKRAPCVPIVRGHPSFPPPAFPFEFSSLATNGPSNLAARAKTASRRPSTPWHQ